MTPIICPFCNAEAERFDEIYADCPACHRVWESEHTEKLREKYGVKNLLDKEDGII